MVSFILKFLKAIYQPKKIHRNYKTQEFIQFFTSTILNETTETQNVREM